MSVRLVIQTAARHCCYDLHMCTRSQHVHMLSACAACHTCNHVSEGNQHCKTMQLVQKQQITTSKAALQRKYAAMTATCSTVWELQDNVIYSGADDCMFKGWDMRTAEAQPTFVNRHATHVCF